MNRSQKAAAEREAPPPPAPEPAPLMDMARLVSDWRPAELERMRQTVLDAACGLTLAAPGKKRGAKGEGEEYLGEHETEWGTFHLYRRAPDTAMLKLLVEQNLGRPRNRSTEKVEPVIKIFTAIEGFEEAPLPRGMDDLPTFGADIEAMTADL
jgi:hypothetical protein